MERSGSGYETIIERVQVLLPALFATVMVYVYVLAVGGIVMSAEPVGSAGLGTSVTLPRLMEPEVGALVVVHENETDSSVSAVAGAVRAQAGGRTLPCVVAFTIDEYAERLPAASVART